ncbi:MAG TPA: hypothetical protein VMK65_07605 [Longimicrobiales bacterium]|nr:hypothetical protein [Longimicrobiales bacterium]
MSAAAWRALAVLAGTLGLVSLAAPAAGQQAESGLEIELRGGLVISTALVEDELASPGLLRFLLGGTAMPDRGAGPVRLAAAPAPMLALAARSPLAPGVWAEVEGGWSFARLEADDGVATWEMDRLGILHVALGARYFPQEVYYLRGGVGLIRYDADGQGLFREGSELTPHLQAGLGTTRGFDRFRISVDLSGQAHRFGTVAMREMGGQDGTVYRGMLQVGVAFGGRTGS